MQLFQLYLQNQQLQSQQPPLNPGLEFGRGVLRAQCNQMGGYYTADNQCLRPPAPQLPARPPSYSCWRMGNMTDCTPY